MPGRWAASSPTLLLPSTKSSGTRRRRELNPTLYRDSCLTICRHRCSLIPATFVSLLPALHLPSAKSLPALRYGRQAQAPEGEGGLILLSIGMLGSIRIETICRRCYCLIPPPFSSRRRELDPTLIGIRVLIHIMVHV